MKTIIAIIVLAFLINSCEPKKPLVYHWDDVDPNDEISNEVIDTDSTKSVSVEVDHRIEKAPKD